MFKKIEKFSIKIILSLCTVCDLASDKICRLEKTFLKMFQTQHAITIEYSQVQMYYVVNSQYLSVFFGTDFNVLSKPVVFCLACLHMIIIHHLPTIFGKTVRFVSDKFSVGFLLFVLAEVGTVGGSLVELEGNL